MKIFNQKFKMALCLLAITVIPAQFLLSDEGMWTYDNPPVKQLKEKYNFELSKDWLQHVSLSSVRFMEGGSGSFVSPNGLVITNHHVAVGQIQKLSTEGNDMVTNGYYADDMTKELKCKDMEINVLVDMTNVTEQIRNSTKGKSDKEVVDARNNEIAKMEKASQEKGLKGEVVSLYHGGEYWLYQYKKYDDVRLVFAPERQAAYYGGDYDNFCYPRWDLDITIFRVYENGKPINSTNFLKWNSNAPKENDLVFISGHPGSTQRLKTYDQLVNMKDEIYPLILKMIDNNINTLREYSKLGPEQERRALIEIFGLANSQKAMSGTLEGLQNPQLMIKKKAEEKDLIDKVNANPELKAKYSTVWNDISNLVNKSSELRKSSLYHNPGSNLAFKALSIIRYIEETKKPDDQRLEGYHDADLEGLKFRLFSKAPIYMDFEKTKFIGAIKFALKNAPADDNFLKTILDGKTIEERANELFDNTKMNDIEFRKKLIDGGAKALKKCTDPMIILAKALDPILREERKQYKEIIESKLVEAEEKIGDARFAVYGKNSYPDATFTLRLTYGSVKGYPMNGTIAPFKTTLYGLFDRTLSFSGMDDFKIPQRFWDNKDKLDLSKCVDFVSTCDIIGGNSGSPTINKNGEFIGIVFDGNIESLPGNFIYDMTKNRAVSCSAEYISNALRNIYNAGKLADELEGK